MALQQTKLILPICRSTLTFSRATAGSPKSTNLHIRLAAVSRCRSHHTLIRTSRCRLQITRRKARCLRLQTGERVSRGRRHRRFGTRQALPTNTAPLRNRIKQLCSLYAVTRNPFTQLRPSSASRSRRYLSSCLNRYRAQLVAMALKRVLFVIRDTSSTSHTTATALAKHTIRPGCGTVRKRRHQVPSLIPTHQDNRYLAHGLGVHCRGRRWRRCNSSRLLEDLAQRICRRWEAEGGMSRGSLDEHHV
jgi:hypothetical protein